MWPTNIAANDLSFIKLLLSTRNGQEQIVRDMLETSLQIHGQLQFIYFSD
jgi:hypothetical protein